MTFLISVSVLLFPLENPRKCKSQKAALKAVLFAGPCVQEGSLVCLLSPARGGLDFSESKKAYSPFVLLKRQAVTRAARNQSTQETAEPHRGRKPRDQGLGVGWPRLGQLSPASVHRLQHPCFRCFQTGSLPSPPPAAEVARNTATVDEMTKPRGQLSVLSPPSTALQGPRKIPLSVLRWGSLNLLVLLWPVWCDGLSPFLFILLLGGRVLSFGHPVVSPILSCVQLSPS